MKKHKLLKINIIIYLIVYILLIFLNSYSYSASINMSINKSSVYVGDTFTVTLSGINGKLTISGTPNISLSPSGTVFVEGTLNITGTAKSEGSGKITITPIDVTTTNADPVEITSPASRSITITQKPAPQTNNNQSNNNSSNKNTSNKNSKNNQPSKKTPTQQEEVIIEEEATPQFGMYGLTLNGITENGEEQELHYTPEFNINVYEYTMEVENNIVDLKITPYADPYGEFVKIEKPEKLEVGENEILIKMENGENNLTYKLKVIRKESSISETSENEDVSNVDANMQIGPKTMTIPVWAFTLIILLVIIVEAIILKWNLIIDFIKRRKTL